MTLPGSNGTCVRLARSGSQGDAAGLSDASGLKPSGGRRRLGGGACKVGPASQEKRQRRSGNSSVRRQPPTAHGRRALEGDFDRSTGSGSVTTRATRRVSLRSTLIFSSEPGQSQSKVAHLDWICLG